MAMNLGLNDASFIVEMLAELTGVRMELATSADILGISRKVFLWPKVGF